MDWALDRGRPIGQASEPHDASRLHLRHLRLRPSTPTASAGLTSAEAAQRLRQDGPNALGGEGRRGPLAVLISQFASPLVLILVAASVVSIVVGDRVEAGIILAIVAMSALLGFVQEARSEAAVAALQARLALRATVIRDGKQQEILIHDVVARRRRGTGRRRHRAGGRAPARSQSPVHRRVVADRRVGRRAQEPRAGRCSIRTRTMIEPGWPSSGRASSAAPARPSSRPPARGPATGRSPTGSPNARPRPTSSTASAPSVC